VESACFRIAQEAFTNVLRHANAQHVRVELEADDEALVLTIRDDGVGFDLDSVLSDSTDRASMGTLGMQERASLARGSISIDSAPGKGTTVQARFPLAERRQGTE
jgi:signal transduction histidine kinase